MHKDTHREITLLAPEDSFLVFDCIKDVFDFPIHFHPEFELNFIYNGKGVRRIIGDHLGEIDNYELVLVGPNLVHGWETYKCVNKSIHEIIRKCIHKLIHKQMFTKLVTNVFTKVYSQTYSQRYPQTNITHLIEIDHTITRLMRILVFV